MSFKTSAAKIGKAVMGEVYIIEAIEPVKGTDYHTHEPVDTYVLVTDKGRIWSKGNIDKAINENGIESAIGQKLEGVQGRNNGVRLEVL